MPEHSFEDPTSINICVLSYSPEGQELGPPFYRWGGKKFKEEVAQEDHRRSELGSWN